MSDAKSCKKADLGAWLAVDACTIGSFMATLGSTMVNSALPTIQGEIGANQNEGAWISSGYLVSEIIMIPLAGRTLPRRRCTAPRWLIWWLR